MDFRGSTEYLLSLGNEVTAMKLGLDNVRELLAAVGDPHTEYIKVQVAGTNGKGSVCVFLDSICNAADIKTGTYTSPHLVSITERIRIGGVDITEDDFARIATFIRQTSESLVAEGRIEFLPTYFEQVTAIALRAFAEADVELAILETGLGGRLDATTAANAEVAAITQIGVDHQEYLGSSIEQIAAEKAAIIRAGSKAVVAKQSPAAMKVILDHCARAGVVPVTFCEPYVLAKDVPKSSAVVEFRTNRRVYRVSSLGLAGKHQVDNACVAIMVSEILALEFGFPISSEEIRKGLEDARHPGRLEYIGRYLLDGAHNLEGAKALREFLDEFETRPITLIFGAMRDKDVRAMTDVLFPHAENVILTQPDNSRSMSAEDLAASIPGSHAITRTVADALELADEIAGANSVILITGSLYLVGEAKRILNN